VLDAAVERARAELSLAQEALEKEQKIADEGQEVVRKKQETVAEAERECHVAEKIDEPVSTPPALPSP
jgi:pyruvate-formate lyase